MPGPWGPFSDLSSGRAVQEAFGDYVERRFWEEERKWRKEDLNWRDRQRRIHTLSEQWWEAEVEQRALDNARYLWLRFVDRTETLVKERVLGLMLISRLSALLAGFTTTGTMQYQVPTTAPMWQQIMYGVAVMAGATFSILAMGLSMHIATGMQLMCQKLVSQEPEAAFLGHCHDFVTQYQRGDRPPRPSPTFETVWETHFRNPARLATLLFHAAVTSCMLYVGAIGILQFPGGLGQWMTLELVVLIGACFAVFKQLGAGLSCLLDPTGLGRAMSSDADGAAYAGIGGGRGRMYRDSDANTQTRLPFAWSLPGTARLPHAASALRQRHRELYQASSGM